MKFPFWIYFVLASCICQSILASLSIIELKQDVSALSAKVHKLESEKGEDNGRH